MKIVGLVSGLAITAALIPLLGLLPAFMIGVLVGGIISFILQALVRENAALPNAPQKSMASESDTENLSQIEVARRLKKIKRIPVETEAAYLADIVARIEGGEAQACWNIGECFLNGKVFLADPFPKDKRSALFWFRRSAELGLAASQYHLGIMYLGDTASELGLPYSYDDEIEKRMDEAIKWLSRAADQSDTFSAFAQDVLGEMYFLGIGVSQDHARAFDLFTKSLANPENISVKMGTPTRAWERLPILKVGGFA